jgi:hypothetical protein
VTRKLEGKWPFGSPRYKWKVTIKLIVRVRECGLVAVVLVRIKPAVGIVNTVMNVRPVSKVDDQRLRFSKGRRVS